MSNIILLVLTLIGIMLMFLIVFSLHTLKSDDEIESKLENNDYINTGNILVLFVLIGLFYILFYNILDQHLNNETILVLVTVFSGSAIIGTFGILPILTLANKHSLKVTQVLKFLILTITYILIPLSFIYILFKKVVYKPVKTKMTEDEFLDIIDKAEQEDGINESEKDLIKSVLDFDDLKVVDIYTPRIDIIAVEEDLPIDDIVKTFKTSGLSRLPVYTKSIDNIIGTINHKDFYNDILLGKNELNTIIQKPVEVPEYMAAKNLLTLLKTNKSHMAIVKDEYGGTLGIVTMEDILEELVGDIWDEHDKVTTNIKKINDKKYFILGQTYLDELNDIFDFGELYEEDYSTVNGWVLSNLGKMGKPGDKFNYDDKLEVIVRNSNNKMILEIELNIL